MVANETEIIYKKCYGKYGCYETKPINEFGKNKHTKDGHSGYCKKCASRVSRMRRHGEIDKLIEIPEGYRRCACTENSCGKIKPLEEFILDKITGNYNNQCKDCVRKSKAKYQKNNNEKIRIINKKISTKRMDKNKEKNANLDLYEDSSLKKCSKCKKNKKRIEFSINRTNNDGLDDYCRECRKNNRSKRKKENTIYVMNRYNTDILYKLKSILRHRLRQVLKGKIKAGSAVQDLGCSVEELKFYLEAKFQPNMSWENYGEWHIDHIKPLALFDLTNPEQVKLACHYTNLQPLWAYENLSKGAKYNEE